MNSTKKNNLLLFILIVLTLEAILFSIGNDRLNIAFRNKENQIKKIQNTFLNIPIEARAISIYNQTLGRKIYGKNDNIGMPIASLAKIMTAVIALNNKPTNDIISVSLDAIKQEGDYGLFVNEKFKIKDLTEFTLIGSVNDGAYALAQNTDNSLKKMNGKARKIGMENTLFLNSTGLDIDENTAGAYASAQDVNIMSGYALKAYPEIFGTTIMPEIKINSISGFNHKIKNTNNILNKIPNILFSKTGFTPLAGGNLTIIYKNKYGHNIAITVLDSTFDGRFSDMEKIVNTLYNIEY